MAWLWTIIIGFIVGLLARAIKPGANSMGWILTIILGIVGAFVGGLIEPSWFYRRQVCLSQAA